MTRSDWLLAGSITLIALLGGRAYGACSCSPASGNAPVWTQLNTAHTPTPRMHHRSVYDAARDVVVLFGGANACTDRRPMSDTWEFDGVDWRRVVTATSPPARYHGEMAFDSIRQVVVLFGGTDSATSFSDTWEYDGRNWVQRFPATSPPGCSHTALAYDPLRQRVVARGKVNDAGDGSCPMAGQTWEFDGTTWTEVLTANEPPDSNGPNWQAFFAWDSTRAALLYFVDNAVWTYDGTDWSLLESFSCGIEGIGFDSGRGAVVMSPLFSPPEPISFGTTYEWRSSPECARWINHTVYPQPRSMGESPLVDVSARGYLLLYGGFTYCSSSNFTDTWVYMLDSDGDGYADAADCAPNDPAIYPGAPPVCDGKNNDCAASGWPSLPLNELDGDGDGLSGCAGDCDDSDPLRSPGALERCNGLDDDCDGEFDEDDQGTDTDGDFVRNACDNCRGAYNPDQLEADGDGIGNACDNCITVANPDQADQDSDQRGNACDNCQASYNPLQDDFDGDRRGDACDNCIFDHNPSQSNVDTDGQGDICDLDDGLIYVFSTDKNYREWQAEVGFSSWNSYRGSLGVLKSTGVYTQAPGSNPAAARECGVTEPWVFDDFTPALGDPAFLLVAGVASGVESGLGANSAGSARTNTSPCP